MNKKGNADVIKGGRIDKKSATEFGRILLVRAASTKQQHLIPGRIIHGPAEFGLTRRDRHIEQILRLLSIAALHRIQLQHKQSATGNEIPDFRLFVHVRLLLAVGSCWNAIRNGKIDEFLDGSDGCLNG